MTFCITPESARRACHCGTSRSRSYGRVKWSSRYPAFATNPTTPVRVWRESTTGPAACAWRESGEMSVVAYAGHLRFMRRSRGGAIPEATPSFGCVGRPGTEPQREKDPWSCSYSKSDAISHRRTHRVTVGITCQSRIRIQTANPSRLHPCVKTHCQQYCQRLPSNPILVVPFDRTPETPFPTHSPRRTLETELARSVMPARQSSYST